MNEICNANMMQRLLDVPLGRRRQQQKPLTKSNISLSDIQAEEACIFSVKSQSLQDVTYTVDMNIGMCNCRSGQTGALSKHQVACSEHHLACLPQVNQLTPENKRWLAGIAVGESKLPPLEFFMDLRESMPVPSTITDGNAACPERNITTFIECEESILNDFSGESLSFSKQDISLEPCIELLHKTVSKFSDALTDDALSVFMKRLGAVQSSNRLNSLFHTAGSTGASSSGAVVGRLFASQLQ